MSTLWKAVLGVILVFVFGFASGVVSSSIYVHHKITEILKHPAVALSAALEKRLTKNLNLDADQRQKIHQIFLENLQQRKELQKQIQPQVRMVNLGTFQEINGILRPDQQELFRQNLTELKTRFTKIAGTDGNLPPLLNHETSPATNTGTDAAPGQ